ncbi:MAG: hypothetical protein JW871_03325 [Endomicrobiales bacterium]|nr:hypothetical protein [Endomicrobiales bacterium]
MELLVIILNKTELLKDVTCVLVEQGITKATVLDSEGLGQFLAYEIPIFAGLRSLVGETKSHNRTILSVIDEKDILPKLIKAFKEIELDFTQSGSGIIFTIPVNDAVKKDKA